MCLVYYVLEVGHAHPKVSGVTKRILEAVKKSSRSSGRGDSSREAHVGDPSTK